MLPRIFVLLSLFASPLLADQTVYRWVDENGQVHFGSRPQGSNAESIDVRTPAVSGDPVKSERERAEARRRLLQSYERDREIKREAKHQSDEEQRRRDRLCQELKRHWRNLNHGGPIYYKNDQGGRRFLDESERQAEKDDISKRIKRTCR